MSALQSTSPFLRNILLPVCLLALSACSTTRLTDPQVPDWEQHQARLLEQESWILQGRLNIRSSHESRTVSIRWQQDGELFDISLTGTLGMGATSIRGFGDHVLLQQPDQESLRAPDLASLGRHYLGYEFPADSLYYWIRGIPAPDGRADYQLDDLQRLQHLSQQDRHGNDWQLRYDRYISSDGLVLPGRIRMEHPEHSLTFIINNWQTTGK